MGLSRRGSTSRYGCRGGRLGLAVQGRMVRDPCTGVRGPQGWKSDRLTVPQLGEHHRIDPLDAVHPLLEVLDPSPRIEVDSQIVAHVAESGQAVAQLRRQWLVDGQPLLGRGLTEVELVQVVEARE